MWPTSSFRFFFSITTPPPRSTLFPYTTLFRSSWWKGLTQATLRRQLEIAETRIRLGDLKLDRKSTRLNSSHEWISYAVFCLKKKKERRGVAGDRTGGLRCLRLTDRRRHRGLLL